ncbi:trypsin-like serine peptidase [Rhodoplanes sp. Z2-YC6860]|uniref:trypsin-like serine peptidase n=1 Tax=Rhodoplanes sp. Z2-YC6860 TaxID=674703 RepID=UPI00078D1101|nr:trypsin-like serine protease [Rhodoplanes sp. Z2-YC6860]AMN43021.1 peptidase S1/S6 [Rhodoplanes sp. Z2-YC6860]
MFGASSRALLVLAAFCAVAATEAFGGPVVPATIHREDVDTARYPWTAIGKLFNETGASCSGVLISRDEVLTAAHCLYNFRTRRFIPAAQLHFLAGYRTGRYAAHVRIARYEVGPGFDPERYDQTTGADWAVLTVTESLPDSIEPLRLRRHAAPAGTKAVLAGYPQDRAFALTADRDCELRGKIAGGQLMLHTCRGVRGTSGAPILVGEGDGNLQIAAIQIAVFHADGVANMVAVPAESIRTASDNDDARRPEPVVATSFIGPVCIKANDDRLTMAAIHDRVGIEDGDIVASIPQPDMQRTSAPPAVNAYWLGTEPGFPLP